MRSRAHSRPPGRALRLGEECRLEPRADDRFQEGRLREGRLREALAGRSNGQTCNLSQEGAARERAHTLPRWQLPRRALTVHRTLLDRNGRALDVEREGMSGVSLFFF